MQLRLNLISKNKGVLPTKENFYDKDSIYLHTVDTVVHTVCFIQFDQNNILLYFASILT